ncbi:MAG: glycogen debranching protein, partial [Candidatus Hydrogenedentes bacterium]|nr:glycogen debranching protein [Candidatus Hydrogenedentota bacterium]
ADRYAEVCGEIGFWRDELLPVCDSILKRYARGTRFGIRPDADGLLGGGSPRTQLTWMDAKLDEQALTPRHGKAVEVNALWCSAHAVLADRCRRFDSPMADRYADLVETISVAFVRTFWNEQVQWLNDVVNENGADASLRPNQIFAVSLPHSPLSPRQQKAVVCAVRENLLTPFGLRTLCPTDPRYSGRCDGNWESRQRAYHQGTVWAWLIAPFIEAYLKSIAAAGGDMSEAVAQAKEWLLGFDGHLDRAALGSVSEIFDGDEPHTPRGCFAQAWSVGEVLRAKLLVAKYETHCETR